MAPGDDLTPQQRERIAPYVTDPVGPVFAHIKQTRGNVSHVLRSLGHAPDGLRSFAAFPRCSHRSFDSTAMGRAANG